MSGDLITHGTWTTGSHSCVADMDVIQWHQSVWSWQVRSKCHDGVQTVSWHDVLLFNLTHSLKQTQSRHVIRIGAHALLHLACQRKLQTSDVSITNRNVTYATENDIACNEDCHASRTVCW